MLVLLRVVGLDRGIWWYCGCDWFMADYGVRIADLVMYWQLHSEDSR